MFWYKAVNSYAHVLDECSLRSIYPDLKFHFISWNYRHIVYPNHLIQFSTSTSLINWSPHTILWQIGSLSVCCRRSECLSPCVCVCRSHSAQSEVPQTHRAAVVTTHHTPHRSLARSTHRSLLSQVSLHNEDITAWIRKSKGVYWYFPLTGIIEQFQRCCLSKI